MLQKPPWFKELLRSAGLDELDRRSGFADRKGDSTIVGLMTVKMGEPWQGVLTPWLSPGASELECGHVIAMLWVYASYSVGMV